MINDDRYTYSTKYRFHYRKEITTVIKNITYCMLCVDGIRYGDISTDRHLNKCLKEKSLGKIILDKLNQSIEILESFDMMKCISPDYKSIIDMNHYVDMYTRANERCETMESLLDRTKSLADLIVKDPEYQNAVFVSHLSVIKTVIANLYQDIYGDQGISELNRAFSENHSGNDFGAGGKEIDDDKLKSYQSICEHYSLSVGSVLKLVIDPDNKTIELSNESHKTTE